jgi:hypothetical protein
VGDCQYGNKLKRARRADEELVVEGDHAKRSDRRSHAEASPGWSAANHVEETAWRKNCFCSGSGSGRGRGWRLDVGSQRCLPDGLVLVKGNVDDGHLHLPACLLYGKFSRKRKVLLSQ